MIRISETASLTPEPLWPATHNLILKEIENPCLPYTVNMQGCWGEPQQITFSGLAQRYSNFFAATERTRKNLVSRRYILLIDKQVLPVTAMAAVGSLLFCTACGNLLDGLTGDLRAILICNVCGTSNSGQSCKGEKSGCGN